MKLFKALLMMVTMLSFATPSRAQEPVHAGSGPAHSASLMGVTQNGVFEFDCDVIPTRTAFDKPWKLSVNTTDGNGKPIIVRNDCMWVYNGGNGRWQLFVTKPKTTFPTGGDDFKDGDTFILYAPDDSEMDTGKITRHTTIQHLGGYNLTVYSYTAHCVGVTPH